MRCCLDRRGAAVDVGRKGNDWTKRCPKTEVRAVCRCPGGGADILASNVQVQKSERRAHDRPGLSSLHGLDVWDGQGGGLMSEVISAICVI